MPWLNGKHPGACCKAFSQCMVPFAVATNPEQKRMCSPSEACLLPSCIWHSHSALQALVQQQEPLQRKPEPGSSSGHSTDDHEARWWNCIKIGVCKSSGTCPWTAYVIPKWICGAPTAQGSAGIERNTHAPQGARRARQAAAMAANINRPPTPEAEHRELSMEDHVQHKVLCFALMYCSSGQAMSTVGPSTDTNISAAAASAERGARQVQWKLG